MEEVTNEFGLTPRNVSDILRILSAQPTIERVHIFGSRAKGTYHSGSDVDLAIMNEGVDFKMMNQLSTAFQESSLPYVVDVVNYPEIKHVAFKEHIDRVGKMFYQRQTTP